MKKYLMTGVAALALCAGFTACSSDEDFSFNENEYVESQKALIEAKYQQAFVNAFGQPAKNHTWGFGQYVTTTRATDFLKSKFTLPEYRDVNPIQKPTVPSAYQNTIPSGAKYARDYQNYQKGDVIYINTAYQTLNQPQNTEDLTIYVDGNVTYLGGTNQNGNGTVFCVTENSTLKLGSVSNNLTVYLAPGATLDITKGLEENVISWYPYQSEIVETGNNSFSFQNPHAAIYMSQGSHLNANDLSLVNDVELLNDGGTIEANNLKLDEKCTLWNEGTIKVTNTLTLTNTSSALYNPEGKTIETVNLDLINNDALLFNEGTVTATGAITLHNSEAEIINYGTLNGASFSSAAGGKMHNEGTGVVTITGKTDLTNVNSKWTNDGHWTCGSMEVSGTDKTGQNNFNNCYLTVNGEFYLNRGSFILDSEAGVVCESFKIDDTSGFYLGNNSVLDISGTLTTEIINPEYGFFAYGSEYAVVQANGIETTTNDPQSINYYGNLLVAINPHLSSDYYTAESTVKFTKDGDNIATIPATECNPGYEGTDPKEIKVRILCEDMNADPAGEKGDFDFNDAVIDLTLDGEDVATAKVIGIELLHTGAQFDITVEGIEVHQALKLNKGQFGSGKYVFKDNEIPANKTAAQIEIITYRDFTYTNAQGEKVTVNTPLTLQAPDGKAPAKILVGVDCDYPDERQAIDAKYELFTTWVGDSNPNRAPFWRKNNND
jgi:hypothetical protein